MDLAPPVRQPRRRRHLGGSLRMASTSHVRAPTVPALW